MATISTVSVDFVANTAKYTNGLTKMQSDTKKFSRDAEKEFKNTSDSFAAMGDKIGRIATGLISVAAISKLTVEFSQLAKQISILADEAEKVGASASQFSLLDQYVKRTGGSIGDVSRAYIELRKSINEANNGNKDTILGFQQLGVSFRYLSELSPDKRFLAVAAALSKITDENERARIGTLLLGKSYNEIAPLVDNGISSLTKVSRFSLSDEQIQKIDTLGKSFEQVTNEIKYQFQTLLITVYPVLDTLAKALLLISENVKLIGATFVAIFAGNIFRILDSLGIKLINIFGGSYLKEFTNASGSAIKGVIDNVQDLFRAMSEQALTKNGVFASIWGYFSAIAVTAIDKIKVAWAGLVAFMAASGFTVLGGLTAALGAFTLGVVGGLKLFQKANELAADIAEKFGNQEYARELRIRAEGYAKTLELLVTPFTGDTSGLTPEIIAQRAAAAGLEAEQAARKAAKAENDFALSIKGVVEEGKKYAEEMQKFGRATEESIKTPAEKAQDEIDKLNEAFLFGFISLDTYNKAIDKLKGGLDGITRAQISLNSELTTFNNERERFSGRGMAAETFGAGTIVGTLGQPGGKAAPLPKGFTQFTSEYEKQQESLKNLGTQLLENGKTAQEVYDRQVQAINVAVEAYQAQGREEEALILKTKALKAAQEELFLATNPWVNDVKNIFSNFASGFENAIIQARSFSDVLKGLAQDILRVLLRQLVLRQLFNAIGGAFGGTFGIPANLGNLIYGGPRAMGGPVSAGTAYTVGETGPEMFVPGTNGYILPNEMTSGETIIVNQTINVETGVSQTVRAEMATLLPRFKQEAMTGVLEAKQRGGSYARGLSAA